LDKTIIIVIQIEGAMDGCVSVRRLLAKQKLKKQFPIDYFQ
jgi:hypothetical protein